MKKTQLKIIKKTKPEDKKRERTIHRMVKNRKTIARSHAFTTKSHLEGRAIPLSISVIVGKPIPRPKGIPYLRIGIDRVTQEPGHFELNIGGYNHG